MDVDLKGPTSLELLSDANALLLAGADPEALIQTIAERVLRYLDCDVFFNFVFDEARGKLHLNAYAGITPEAAAEIEWLERGVAICGCVALTGERIVSEDVQSNGDPRAELVRSMGVRAYACQPLRVGTKTVGTLSFGTKKRDKFTSGELSLMLAIADQVSIAMERKRAEQELQARQRRQEFILELADAVRTMRDPSEIQVTASRMLGQHLGANRVGYAESEDEGRTAVVALNYTDGVPGVEGRHSLEDFGADVLKGLRAGRTVAREDVAHDPSLSAAERNAYERLQVLSTVNVPVIKESGLVAVLFVHQSEPRRWSRDEIALLEEVAERTWDAVDRARLASAERQRIETQRLLLQAAAALSSSMDMQEVLTRLADIARELTRTPRVFVNLVDMAKATLTPVVPREGVVAPEGNPIPFARLSATSREAILSGQTAILDYEAPETPEYDKQIARANNCRLVLFVPLVFEGEMVGHLALDEPGKRHHFTGREIELIEGIASQAAIAVQNAKLFEAQRESARYAEALSRIGDSIHSTLEIDEIMRRVVEEAALALDMDAVAVEVREDGGWPIRYAHGMPEGFAGASITPRAALARMAGESRRPVVISDTREKSGLEIPSQFTAILAVPLFLRADTFGVLVFLELHGPRIFSGADIEFATRLAASVSLALVNSKLYETEHAIAETLQETLVVLPSQISGVEFSRAYESATFESGRVGGDFVDVFEVGAETVGVALGDVSGKGIDAAVTTSLIRTTLRVHALDGQPPASVAAKANDVMRRFSETEAFVTLWFGLLHTTTGLLRYICAGHPPALVLAADGTISQLECKDPILGAFDRAVYFESQAVLAPGDRLVLYSDGVTEARSPGGRFLYARGLLELIGKNAGEPTAAITARIMEDVVSFSAGVLRDDAALLVVEPTALLG